MSRSSPTARRKASPSIPRCSGSGCGSATGSRPGQETALDLVYLDLGGTTVELISWQGVNVAPEPAREHLGFRMIALEVEDMERAAEYLKGRGVDIVWGPVVRDTYARAEIRDPNGFHIELRQWFR